MSLSFANKISVLRRNKNITQKEAAMELGISQALLSHYEKGIRECNFDFLVKIANYYGVSTDYLLGNSTIKHDINLYFDSDNDNDKLISIDTVVHCFSYISSQAEYEGENMEKFFTDFFSLAIKKYRLMTGKKNYNISKIYDSIELSTKDLPKLTEDSIPTCIQTIEDHAKDLVEQTISIALK